MTDTATWTTSVNRQFDPLDISSHTFWAKPPAERDEVFAQLRRDRPVSWHRPAETDLMPNSADPGFWAVVCNADIVAVSRASDVFSSVKEFGGVMLEDIPAEILEATHSLLALDPPQHARQRRLISSVFTPRRVVTIEKQVRRQASRIVDDIEPLGELDFVERVAARLPLWTISEMIGIPQEHRDEVAAAAGVMAGTTRSSSAKTTRSACCSTL